MPKFEPGDRVRFRDGMTVLGDEDIYTINEVNVVYNGNGGVAYVAYRFFETPFIAYEDWLERAEQST